jgi:hypothetical protein
MTRLTQEEELALIVEFNEMQEQRDRTNHVHNDLELSEYENEEHEQEQPVIPQRTRPRLRPFRPKLDPSSPFSSLKQKISIPSPEQKSEDIELKKDYLKSILWTEKNFPKNTDPVSVFEKYFDNEKISNDLIKAIEFLRQSNPNNEYGIMIRQPFGQSYQSDHIVCAFGIVRNVTVTNSKEQHLHAGDVMFVYGILPRGSVSTYKVRLVRASSHYCSTGWFNSHKYSNPEYCDICYGRSNILDPFSPSLHSTHENYFIGKLMQGNSQVSWEDLENTPTHSISSAKGNGSSGSSSARSQIYNWIYSNFPSSVSSSINQDDVEKGASVLQTNEFFDTIINSKNTKLSAIALDFIQELSSLSSHAVKGMHGHSLEIDFYVNSIMSNEKFKIITYLAAIFMSIRMSKQPDCERIKYSDIFEIIPTWMSPYQLYANMEFSDERMELFYNSMNFKVSSSYIPYSRIVARPQENSFDMFGGNEQVFGKILNEEALSSYDYLERTSYSNTTFNHLQPRTQSNAQTGSRTVTPFEIKNQLASPKTIKNEKPYQQEETQNQTQTQTYVTDYLIIPSKKLGTQVLFAGLCEVERLNDNVLIEEGDFVHIPASDRPDSISLWQAFWRRVEWSSFLRSFL